MMGLQVGKSSPDDVKIVCNTVCLVAFERPDNVCFRFLRWKQTI